jgi:hypothetical protein
MDTRSFLKIASKVKIIAETFSLDDNAQAYEKVASRNVRFRAVIRNYIASYNQEKLRSRGNASGIWLLVLGSRSAHWDMDYLYSFTHTGKTTSSNGSSDG